MGNMFSNNNYSYNNWSDYNKQFQQFPGHNKSNWANGNAENKNLRKTVNYYTQVASVAHGNNPTYITPQFRQRLDALRSNTVNAQNDLAKKAQDGQFAQSGMYGQGAHQAAAQNLAATNAKNMAQMRTQTENDLEQQNFKNWNDWVNTRFGMQNQLDQLAIQKQQLELKRAQLASQNKAMDAATGGGANWGSLVGAGLGFLGNLLG